MTEEQYNRMADRLRQHPGMISLILMVNRILTALGFLAYPGLILFLLFQLTKEPGPGFSPGTGIKLFLLYMVGPGLAFILLSAYRTRKNTPRPYEALDIRPIILKDTRGNSFPSRHLFSLSLIAALWVPISLPIGIVLLVSSLLLALIRVVGGVHYIRDVITGFLIGSGCGIVIGLLSALL